MITQEKDGGGVSNQGDAVQSERSGWDWGAFKSMMALPRTLPDT